MLACSGQATQDMSGVSALPAETAGPLVLRSLNEWRNVETGIRSGGDDRDSRSILGSGNRRSGGLVPKLARQFSSGMGTDRLRRGVYLVGTMEDNMTGLVAGDDGTLRTFETGATRDTAEGKLDYEGFLSPRVLEAFAQYMDFNRVQSDGSRRDSDNWQKGIPIPVYMKSMWRHFFDVWKLHREMKESEMSQPFAASLIVWSLCALMFNVQGMLHELLKQYPTAMKAALQDEEAKTKGVPLGTPNASEEEHGEERH